MRTITGYYVLQDKITRKYFGIDKYSGGYPWFSNDFNNCEHFKNLEEIEKLYNGGESNGAYKQMFSKECENLVPKLVTVITDIED